VTARTYLSIGDVLTLLREEFPDVTISKIRFLESQGLVNPERSPSGYRKFFETDVERLRWVLRQQREHFLPLKVIRDRLADGDLGEEEAAASEAAASESATSESAATHGNGKVSEPAHAAAGARGAGRSAAGGATGGGTATVTAEPPGQSQADDEAMARILADASRRSVRAPGGNAGPSVHAIPDPAAPVSPTHLVPDPDAPSAPSPAVAGPLPVAAAPPVATVAAQESSAAAGDTRSSGRAAAPVTPPPTAVARATSTVRPPRHAPTAAGVTSPSSAPPPAPPGPGPAAEGHGDDAPVVDDDVAPGPEVTAAAGRTTGGRASGTGTGAPGAPAPGGAESGAAAPRERAAAGAAGRQPGTQSAKNTHLEPGADADPGAHAEPGVHADPAAPVPPEAPAAPRAAAGASRAASAAAASAAPQTSGMVTGASLTAEELCAASGLSEAELANLQGFGLIEPVMVAGIPTFDEDALTVANLAAAFRKFGIEARHLRPYRNAVDREVGLIEQVIIPLLRQRNPESRQRAAEAADELGALGQTMRATLMRAALRRHVGG
jgi:DNA-binding transcriptional MerR regulator